MSAAPSTEFDFDFFDAEPDDEDADMTADEIEAMVDVLIEAAFGFETAIRTLQTIQLQEEDETALWTALKTLDAYQGLLNRAAIHQRVTDLDTP